MILTHAMYLHTRVRVCVFILRAATAANLTERAVYRYILMIRNRMQSMRL